MATVCETLGISPFGSASVPADDAAKAEVAKRAGAMVVDLLRRGLTPRQILTGRAIENAIASVAATGGSTNAVLHLLAIAHEAGVPLEIDDFDRISGRVPLLADLKPGGKFVATDLHRAGGIPLVIQRLAEAGILHQEAITVSGRTIGEHAREAVETSGQEVVRPVAAPIKPTGGLVILKGNLAPEGAVVKVAGYDTKQFVGPARVFDSEEAAFAAVRLGGIHPGDVVAIRYEGPRGGPGMREMLARHGGLDGRRARRLGGPAHGRPLLRRDARADGRPRRPRSGARRPDRRPPRGGHRPLRPREPRAERRPARRRAGGADAEPAGGAAADLDRRDGEVRQAVSSASMGAVTV